MNEEIYVVVNQYKSNHGYLTKNEQHIDLVGYSDNFETAILKVSELNTKRKSGYEFDQHSVVFTVSKIITDDMRDFGYPYTTTAKEIPKDIKKWMKKFLKHTFR